MSKEAHNAVESYDFVDPATGKAAIRDKHMLVLYCLAYNADVDGVAWVGLEKLASHAHTSKRHVIRLIQELEEKGYLAVRRPSKAGRGRSNLYVLRLPPLDNEAAKAKATQLSHLLESGLGIREAASLLKGDNPTRKGDFTTPDQPLIGVIENTNTHNTYVNETGSREDKRAIEPIPDSFCLTEEMRRWAERSCPGIDVEAETDEFISFWREGKGRGFKKADWSATWRKRMLAQSEFRQPNPVQGANGTRGGRGNDMEGNESAGKEASKRPTGVSAGERGERKQGPAPTSARLIIRGSQGLDTVTS